MKSYLQLHFEIKHGEGITPYYNTIINSTFEVCQVLNGTGTNPVIKWVIDAMADTAPKDFFRPCPYFDRLTGYNISLSAGGVLRQFLKGRYKGVVRAFNEKDENIITVKIQTEL